MGRHTVLLRYFHQALGVGAISGAHHQQQVAIRGRHLHRQLAVLRGIADVVARRVLQGGEPRAQPGHDVLGFVEAERGLGDVADLERVGHLEPVHVGEGLHNLGALRSFAQGTCHLVVVPVSDQDDGIPQPGESPSLQVHLRDQGAGGVDDP